MKTFRIFLLLLIITKSSIAQNTLSKEAINNFSQDFTKFVKDEMKKNDVTGLNVSISIGNDNILSKGFGFSNKEKQIKTAINQTYRVGSVSKVVTATAILKLYSDGLIDIDKPYQSYVTDFSMKSHHSETHEFTIRHLLSHYAGLPRLKTKNYLKKNHEPLENILKMRDEEYAIAKPGYVYQYSDFGTDLLALLVGRVTSQSYEEYVAEHIFKPLGMVNSYFGPIKSGKAYVKGKETKTYNYSGAGSDDVSSSSPDLLKIAQLYYNEGKLDGSVFIKPTIIQEAISKQYVDAPMSSDKGSGFMWDIRDLKGFKSVKKAGIHEPYYSYIFFIPEYKAAITICSNSNASSSIHWSLWSKYFSFLSEEFGFHDSQIKQLKERQNLKKTKLTDEEWKKIEGTYNTNIGILNLERNKNKFKVELATEGKKGIGIPYSDNLIKLYVKVAPIKVHAMDVFWDEVDGEIIIGEQYKSGNRNIIGSKIIKNPIPDSWKEAMGKYKVTNYNENNYKTIDEIELSINKYGILEMNAKVIYPNKFNIQMGVMVKSNTVGILPGYNFDFLGGETVLLNVNGNNTELLLSGFTFQKI